MKIPFVNIVFITLMALGLWYLIYTVFSLINTQKKESAYWRDKAFKTDTVYATTTFEKSLELQPVYREAIPPKTVIIYQPFIPENVLKFQDSMLLVIDSLKERTTTINPLYLRRFPEASKLISANFQKDTIKLDLLNIKGDVISQHYPVDYSAFKYQYLDNSFRGEELKTTISLNSSKRKPFIRYDGTYLYYDRDLLMGEHQVGATAGFDIWKLRVQGWSQYKLQTQARLNGGVRVGYRLF